MNFTCSWFIVLNGKEISRDSVTDHNMLDASDPSRPPQKILWSDDYHYYYLSYYMSDGAADFTIEANYADYKDRQ